jgi:ComF family protein
LKSSGLYDDVDIVVPIPLHYKKLLKRSYNQSTYIAEGIARELGIDYNSHLLYRRRNNPPQARNKASQRWQNVEELFAVRNAKRLQGKHILIVDDVLTTGATICSCVEAILRVAPDCRVSVATLAVTRSIERD